MPCHIIAMRVTSRNENKLHLMVRSGITQMSPSSKRPSKQLSAFVKRYITPFSWSDGIFSVICHVFVLLLAFDINSGERGHILPL